MEPRNTQRAWNTNLLVAATLGAGYAIAMRLGFDGGVHGFELMTRCFFIGVPLATGALTMWLSLRAGQGVRNGLLAMCLAVGVFIVTCMLTGLEGIICIVLLLPVLITLPLFGALAAYAGWRLLSRRGRATLPALALLPLMLAPLEHLAPIDTTPYTITDRVVVRATPDRIWNELTHVNRIGRDELRPAFIFWMGVPRPLEARMDGEGIGASRESRWEKNVVFRERVTRWSPGREMSYDFVIDPTTVPAAAFDEHVRIGGRHYRILRGSYRMKALPAGATELTLSTTIANHSHTGWYGRAWSELVFDDFHGVILDLIRLRAEAPDQH